MRVIEDKISLDELRQLATETFGDMVKAVVDIHRIVMCVGGELHSDEEALLIEHGSKQADVWGINLYPNVENSGWIEFDSMINVRPSQGNRSRGVNDEKLRLEITQVVKKLTA